MKNKIFKLLENRNYKICFKNKENEIKDYEKTLNRILSNKKYYKNNIIEFKYNMKNELIEIEIKIIDNRNKFIKYSNYYIIFEN